MARFNIKGHQAKPVVATASSPLRTTSRKVADTRTFQGGLGWLKDPKTDLFIRASASFADGKDTFYESGYQRDETLRQLARQVAVEDFAWFAQFVKWLRRTANIRTTALMTAADGVKARLDAGLMGDDGKPAGATWDKYSNRSVIDSVLYRADEPGELLAYWMNQYGRKIPKPVKRGVADAVRRLYNERSLLKYDTASHGVRFGDVLNLVHPEHKLPADYLERLPEHRLDGMTKADRLAYIEAGHLRMGQLFQYALDRRHHPDTATPSEALTMVRANRSFRERTQAAPHLAYSSEALNEAGFTWEDALSMSGQLGIDKRKIWESVIPSMGYMALIRNLRNFDEAGVSNVVASKVIAKLQDPEQVANSRQLPFRFYSAYRNAPSLRWGHALETALDLCLPNIPDLPGRTLVLVDTSGSMTWYDSNGNGSRAGTSLKCLSAAALFGAALALKNDRTTLVTFDTDSRVVQVPRGGSVLRLTDAIVNGPQGGATYTQQAITRHYDKHDRVIVLTDEQSHMGGYSGDIAVSVPGNVPVYSFCLVGYAQSMMPTGEKARFQLGGLSDQTFKLIPILEAGSGAWPWEDAA